VGPTVENVDEMIDAIRHVLYTRIVQVISKTQWAIMKMRAYIKHVWQDRLITPCDRKLSGKRCVVSVSCR